MEEESDVEANRDSGGEEESQGASGSSGEEWSGADEQSTKTDDRH